jgi:arsenical pump membrane protein
VYACAHLANSASLLLPVSNLTNLLAFRAAGVSFARFGALMALPWLAVIAVEYAVFRRFFAADLTVSGGWSEVPNATGHRVRVPVPVFALAVVGATLLGFGLSSLLGVDPAWPAAIGAFTLVVRRVFRDPGRWRAQSRAAVRASNLPFLVFVLALGVVVRGVEDNGVGGALVRVLPVDAGLLGLLLLAFAAALLANLVNNLPAILVLLPAVSGHGPGLVLAALIGVNVGPNLTYVGSLATLLWRRLLHHRDAEPALGEFLRLGALTVPAALTAGVLALWVSVRWLGG